MKILLVGQWRWEHYEQGFAKGLNENGVEVIPFSTEGYFDGLMGYYQSALPILGPAMLAMNKKVISMAFDKEVNFVLFWRPTHIMASTIKKIRKRNIVTISYNNDDPFGPKAHGNVPLHHHYYWRLYINNLKYYDKNFFYRKINCEEAIAYGARHADVLLPYFLPWKDRPVILDDHDHSRYDTDVVFIGHYEDDGRVQFLKALIDAGIKVKIWGGKYWNNNKVLGGLYDRIAPIVPVEGSEYTIALSSAKICLAFLSKMNRDTYTRRCFEIPACGKVMLAERTDDLKCFFKEDEEACFYSTTKELVRKTQWLLENPIIRNNIAQAGLRRVWSDGHDVVSRAKAFIQSL